MFIGNCIVLRTACVVLPRFRGAVRRCLRCYKECKAHRFASSTDVPTLQLEKGPKKRKQTHVQANHAPQRTILQRIPNEKLYVDAADVGSSASLNGISPSSSS